MYPLIAKLTNKTFLIYSLGCRTNQAEVIQVAAWLENLGLKPSLTNPGVIFINTCAVTEKGLTESQNLVKSLKRKYPKSKLVVMGCGINYQKSSFIKVNKMLNNIEKSNLLTNQPAVPSQNNLYPLSQSGRLLLKIQSGCNRYCSYCVVPFLRRRVYSLGVSDIVKTINEAEKLDYQEVVLTGTNLDLYQDNSHRLSFLVSEIINKTTIPRIAFGSVSFEAFDNKLIKLFVQEWQKNTGRLNRYLHIPLQSGSDRILKRMNRRYSVNSFAKLIELLHRKDPLVNIGTDVIVGFPGETRPEFNKTVSLIKSLPIRRLHIFRYHPRKNTLANKMEEKWGTVRSEEKKYRAGILGQLNKQKQKEFRLINKGCSFRSLFLKKIGSNLWQGLTDNYLVVTKVSKQNLRGKIRPAKIT